MNLRTRLTISLLLTAASRLALAQTAPASTDLATALGVSFPSDSQSTVVLTREGRQYLIDVSSKSVKEIHAQSSGSAQPVAGNNQAASALFTQNCARCHGADGKGIKSTGTPNFTDPAFHSSVNRSEIETAIRQGKDGVMPAWSGKLTDEQISSLVTYVESLAPSGQSSTSRGSSATAPGEQAQPKPKIYQPGDDVLMSLPTGRPTDRHGVYVNFAHRFPYQPAFTGQDEGAQLFGLDNVAIPSFGFRYGVTENLSVSVFRAPSLINRPIQLMAGYNLLEEHKGDPLNLMVRVSLEGQDNFRKNYTENIEAIVSRSITSRAQFYLVPTVSFNDRRLLQPSGFLSNQIRRFAGSQRVLFGRGPGHRCAANGSSAGGGDSHFGQRTGAGHSPASVLVRDPEEDLAARVHFGADNEPGNDCFTTCRNKCILFERTGRRHLRRFVSRIRSHSANPVSGHF